MTKRILVVDDEELVVQTLLKLLSAEGYDVSLAKNGKEALEKVKNGDFDLILCDVRMPDMDGVETISLIRDYLSKSKKPPIPEVLMTGYADFERYEKAVAMKVADYIYKPFDMMEFLAVVKKNLE